MSKNIHQIFIANPITTNASTDLMYFGQSPYSSGANDAAMTFSNFSAQFISSTLSNNFILAGNVSNVATATQTLPTAVQSNITQLGAQSQALNMNSQLINNVATPLSANDAVNKQYADNIAAGLNPIDGVVCATTASLTATYANGTAGVGATLTNSGALAAFSVDGVSPTVGQRVLVKNQASAFQNGIYNLTTVGSGAVAWVLTRSTDYNTPSVIEPGDLIAVQSGTANTGSSWLQTATVTTIGTDAINFSAFFLPSSFVSSALTTGKIYIGNGSNVAVASTATYPNTITANQLMYASAANVIGGLTSANNGILATDGSGVPSISATFGQGLAMASSTLSVGGANNIPFNNGQGLQDNNGKSLLLFSVVASAVNYVNIINAATNNPPLIRGTGTDSSVSLNFQSKGGSFLFSDYTASAPSNIKIFTTSGLLSVGFAAPSSLAGDVLWTLPSVDAAGLMQSNGSGTLTLTNTPALGTPASGTLTNCTGYTVANLSDVAWTDFSGSIGYTGFTGTPTTNLARYKVIGKTLFFEISMTGTSNATTFTITNMPVAAARTLSGGSAVYQGVNSGASNYTVQFATTASSTTLTMLLSNNASGWTNSGTKAIAFTGFYETT